LKLKRRSLTCRRKKARREESREEERSAGEMSRVRIYDLAKELNPECKKSLKVARRMGIAGALNLAGGRRKPPTKKPKKGGAK
jgi:hypothetical protein